jgi:hypothetical protein
MGIGGDELRGDVFGDGLDDPALMLLVALRPRKATVRCEGAADLDACCLGLVFLCRAKPTDRSTGASTPRVAQEQHRGQQQPEGAAPIGQYAHSRSTSRR